MTATRSLSRRERRSLREALGDEKTMLTTGAGSAISAVGTAPEVKEGEEQEEPVIFDATAGW